MEDTHLRLLRLLESKPTLSQRALARELGISLGKINYCLNALIDKGWIKVKNFRDSDNKLGYIYLVTPRGIESKATITSGSATRSFRNNSGANRNARAANSEAFRLA